MRSAVPVGGGDQPGFWMRRCEVTQEEHVAVVGSNPSDLQPPNATTDRNRPAEQASWTNATNCCAALTQLEWAVGRVTAPQCLPACRLGAARRAAPDTPAHSRALPHIVVLTGVDGPSRIRQRLQPSQVAAAGVTHLVPYEARSPPELCNVPSDEMSAEGRGPNGDAVRIGLSAPTPPDLRVCARRFLIVPRETIECPAGERSGRF